MTISIKNPVLTTTKKLLAKSKFIPPPEDHRRKPLNEWNRNPKGKEEYHGRKPMVGGFIHIDQKAILRIAKEWRKNGFTRAEFPRELHFINKDSRRMLEYLILLDSINFCFWSKDPRKKWRIRYQRKEWSGYFVLALSFKKFYEKNPRRATMPYFSVMPFREFTQIFQGNGELLFLKKRWEILRSVAKVILEKYNGDVIDFISSGGKDVPELLRHIVRELPSFDDTANYKGEKIYFWKRAQLLINDIYIAFDGKGIGEFRNLSYLTAFADYKLPQILHFWGILRYHPELEQKIMNRIFIPRDSEEELEIRSATIWAVEYLRRALKRSGIRLFSSEIDNILWNESKRITMDMPHHLTKTIFY